MIGFEPLDVEDLLLLTRPFGAGPVRDVVLLDLNGHAVDLDDDAAFPLAIAAAEGQLDVEQIAQRLSIRAH